MLPVASLLPDGTRLHLQHGPIDLIIGADGQRQIAFEAAHARFATILDELVAELDLLRAPMTATWPTPTSAVARRMATAARPFAKHNDLTAMICVAGAVADEILSAMTQYADLTRAYVNNGGDIALHLDADATFTTAMAGADGTDLGRIVISGRDKVRGIATSGCHGRSHSLGIADSVTVLARSAASADVAATLIANAVDLPGDPAITRTPASHIDPDSDLGDRLVVTGCGCLTTPQIDKALRAGTAFAQSIQTQDLIIDAGLFLQGHARTTSTSRLMPNTPEHLHA